LWWGILSGIFDKISAAIQKVLDFIGKIKLPSLSDLNPFSRSAPGATAMGVGLGASPMALGVTPTGSGRKAGAFARPVQVIVQGAVDPESTARQVNRLLVGHSNRQGLTAGSPRRLAW
jgi:hypothetical protein